MKPRLLTICCWLAVFRCVLYADVQVALTFPEYDEREFPHLSVVSLPSEDVNRFEVVIRDAIAEMEASSVRSVLNGSPLATFTSVARLPRGIRVKIDLSSTINPAFQLQEQGESILEITAQDVLRNQYRSRFFLVVDTKVKSPEIRPVSIARLEPIVEPPSAGTPPQIMCAYEAIGVPAEGIWTVMCQVSDKNGLRHVMLEVNGRETDIIVIENGVPRRKRGGFMTSKSIPGSVTGDGKDLTLEVPVKLKKTINVVSLRAENLDGYKSSAKETIVKPKKK